jgi:hypothetical protein
MRTITAVLKSTSPYSQSRYHGIPKGEKEPPADHNLRTWREQCTTNEEGVICIPGMAIKMALDATAKKLKERVPGKGLKTYTDYFVGGVIPGDIMFPVGVKKDEVDFIDIWANADGVRGSGKRVMRRFPLLPSWEATVSLEVIDDSIPSAVLERYLSEAGKLIGIGRFRPEKGGFNGRFSVKSVKWTN